MQAAAAVEPINVVAQAVARAVQVVVARVILLAQVLPEQQTPVVGVVVQDTQDLHKITVAQAVQVL
jgi:hypothetical protein